MSHNEKFENQGENFKPQTLTELIEGNVRAAGLIKYVLPLLSGILVQDGDNISQIKSSEYKQKFRFANTQRLNYLKFIIYCVVAVIWLLNHVQLFLTPWTIVHSASQSMEFPK